MTFVEISVYSRLACIAPFRQGATVGTHCRYVAGWRLVRRLVVEGEIYLEYFWTLTYR